MIKANKGINLCIKIILFLSVLFLSMEARAADVSVYAEGAYTNSDLLVYIYADTETTELRSFGVKLTYDDTKLSVTNVTRNDIWSLGDDSSYAAPKTSTSGEVIMIGGILDTQNPDMGISGERVLLGIVTFNRLTSTKPPVPTEAEQFFGIQLMEGHVNPFANFVDVAGFILDSPALFTGVIVRERGDANADGIFSIGDVLTTNNLIKLGFYSVLADCNSDGILSIGDILCINSKI